MLGGTTKGFCRREWALWYGDTEDASPCTLPLTDGALCNDVFAAPDNARNIYARCPYNHNGLKVDFEACKLTTYAKHHDRVLATGGAGLAAHNPAALSERRPDPENL